MSFAFLKENGYITTSNTHLKNEEKMYNFYIWCPI